MYVGRQHEYTMLYLLFAERWRAVETSTGNPRLSPIDLNHKMIIRIVLWQTVLVSIP